MGLARSFQTTTLCPDLTVFQMMALTIHRADPEADENGRHRIQWAKLVEEISEQTYDAVKKLGIKGVYATTSFRRAYPHNQLGAHIVGFVDGLQQPIAGVERFADFYLRGHDGWREGERDGRAKELPQFSTRAVDQVDGYSVVLSLDTNVQNIVERELATIAENYQPLKATVVVSNPTHLAISLYFDEAQTPLPIVINKGRGAIALEIMRIAREAGVPVMQNIPLARSLMATAVVDHYIPSELVEPVAEVLLALRRLAQQREEDSW